MLQLSQTFESIILVFIIVVCLHSDAYLRSLMLSHKMGGEKMYSISTIWQKLYSISFFLEISLSFWGPACSSFLFRVSFQLWKCKSVPVPNMASCIEAPPKDVEPTQVSSGTLVYSVCYCRACTRMNIALHSNPFTSVYFFLQVTDMLSKILGIYFFVKSQVCNVPSPSRAQV